MMSLAAVALAGCLAVGAGSDHIVAGDLAAAIPGLHPSAPEAPVALAPAPGVPRIFRVPELRRLALRLQWPVQPDADICIVRPVSPADPERFLAAMQKAVPEASITILEYSRLALPAGDLEFPLSGLRPGNGDALWAGWVRYAGTRRFPVWARVKVLVTALRVIAAADLHPGEAISAEQVRAETRAEFPAATPFLASAGDVVGKWPRLPLRAGTVLRVDMLRNPQEVLRGEKVRVDIRDGTVHLELEAQAEGSGSVGETIPVWNPVTHTRFRARIESKGRVSVTL